MTALFIVGLAGVALLVVSVLLGDLLGLFDIGDGLISSASVGAALTFFGLPGYLTMLNGGPLLRSANAGSFPLGQIFQVGRTGCLDVGDVQDVRSRSPDSRPKPTASRPWPMPPARSPRLSRTLRWPSSNAKPSPEQALVEAERLNISQRKPADAAAYSARVKAEGERDEAKAKAEGEAYEKTTMARASKEATVLEATGKAESVKLEANADAEATKVKGKAHRKAPRPWVLHRQRRQKLRPSR